MKWGWVAQTSTSLLWVLDVRWPGCPSVLLTHFQWEHWRVGTCQRKFSSACGRRTNVRSHRGSSARLLWPSHSSGVPIILLGPACKQTWTFSFCCEWDNRINVCGYLCYRLTSLITSFFLGISFSSRVYHTPNFSYVEVGHIRIMRYT